MFNSTVKKDALARLENSIARYDKTVELVNRSSSELFELRLSSSRDVIQAAEDYINKLANSPKEFEKAVRELKFSFSRFYEVLNSLNTEAQKIDSVAGSTAGAGVLAGAGFAATAPTAAMAIATTFGTASTGTAISTLSGAAATKAALAWLGGGAMAAGGGGMAAGNALLALAGPVGLAIGGFAMVGSGIWASSKNKEIAQKANKQAIQVEEQNAAFQAIEKEIELLIKLTREHYQGTQNRLKFLIVNAPMDYKKFDIEQKKELMALVNNIESLSKLLSKTVGN